MVVHNVIVSLDARFVHATLMFVKIIVHFYSTLINIVKNKTETVMPLFYGV